MGLTKYDEILRKRLFGHYIWFSWLLILSPLTTTVAVPQAWRLFWTKIIVLVNTGPSDGQWELQYYGPDADTRRLTQNHSNAVAQKTSKTLYHNYESRIRRSNKKEYKFSIGRCWERYIKNSENFAMQHICKRKNKLLKNISNNLDLLNTAKSWPEGVKRIWFSLNYSILSLCFSILFNVPKSSRVG